MENANQSNAYKVKDYIYDFAWRYGKYYHVGDSEKIMENVSQLILTPEEVCKEIQIELQAIKAVLELYPNKPCVGGIQELIDKFS